MRSIVVAKYLSPFKKLVAGEHRFELFPAHEMITFPFLLVSPGRPRGVGDAEHEARDSFDQPVHEGGFTAAGGGGDDKDGRHEGRLPGSRCGLCVLSACRRYVRISYSRFRLCSRILSISLLAASARSVIVSPRSPNPPVFERTVLDSRFISWRRKSSFLPTSPFPSSMASS